MRMSGMVTVEVDKYLRIWTVITFKDHIRKLGGREAPNSFITLRGEDSES